MLVFSRIHADHPGLTNATTSTSENQNPAIALLTDLDTEPHRQALARIFGSRYRAYRSLDDLAKRGAEPTLLSFSTSVIVPAEVFEQFPGGAYNLHAASPQYPGRDPHHWAIYDGARDYGATLHVMGKRVDDGPIIDVELFAVAPDEKPMALLERANAAAFQLLARNAGRLTSGKLIVPDGKFAWSGKKHSRKDFLEMCRLDASLSREEFERRVRAFDVPHYDNITVTLHGRTFRLEK
jgi:methionyl-tRNA formyltransferase